MAEQLLQAVHALYQNPDPGVKEQANAWLEAWQCSPEAWAVSDAVLARPDASLEARYLCAQTLRTKIARDFEELPPQSVPSLRDSLLRLLLEYRAGPVPTRTQLCLAVAALAAHLPASEWPPPAGSAVPPGVLSWVRGSFLAGPAPAWALAVELAGMLAGEGAGFQRALRPARRRAFQEELLADLPHAMALLTAALQACASGPGQTTPGAVLDAFASWLRFAACTGAGVSAEALAAASPLVDAALAGLGADGEDELFFQALDASVEIIYASSSRGRPRPELAGLAGRLVAVVTALRPRFHVCCAQAREDRGTDAGPPGAADDSEEAKGLARLFTEVGEAYTDLIATGAPELLPTVEAILDIASHPSDDITSMSFNFWHRLACTLVDPPGAPASFRRAAEDWGSGLVDDGERERRLALFRPAYSRLVQAVQGRVRFPESYDSWHRDEQADFKRARVAVAESLVDAAQVLGGQATLRLLADPLLRLTQGGGAPTPGSPRGTSPAGAFDWRTAEAALYCIRAVHTAAPPPGDPLLLALFAALPGLPASPPTLSYTAALMVGAYADWLAACAGAGAPAVAPLAPLVDLLVRGLADPDASAACALALRRLCEGAAGVLAADMPAMLRLFGEVQPCGALAGARGGASGARPAYDLDEEDVQQLVDGVVAVSNRLETGDRAAVLGRMLDALVRPVQEALTTAAAAAATTSRAPDAADLPTDTLILPLMERVTVVFRASTDAVAIGQALSQIWPLLEALLDVYATDGQALERLCRVPRYGLRGAGHAGGAALPALLGSLPRRFEATGHPAFLYVISEAVKGFGGQPDVAAALRPVFAGCTSAACARLTSAAAVAAVPDLADDVFLLAGRALSYCPELVVGDAGTLRALADAALAGALVQHREACCSILAFLARLLDPALLARSGPGGAAAVREVMTPRGPTLARLLLAGAAGALPPVRTPDLADVLAAWAASGGETAVACLRDALTALPPGAAEPADRERLLAAAAACASAASAGEDARQDLTAALAEFSDVCRRNRRAQLVAEQALLAGTPAQRQ